MPYIDKKALQNYAANQGYQTTNQHKEAIQQSKEKKQQPQQQKQHRQTVGKIKYPPKHILNQLKDLKYENDNNKYIEYRMGIMKFLAKKANSNNTDDFVSKLTSSNDLKKLFFDTSFCKSLDEMAGLPKIILTILSKYAETYY